MVAYPAKLQLMSLGTNSDQQLCLKIDDQVMNQCHQVKVSGLTIDSKLNFDKHIQELCSKVNKNVSAFSTIRNYLYIKQIDKLSKKTVLADFNYCPLIWILSTKAANNEINRARKRPLWELYQNNNSSFDKCLMKEAGIKIHIKNLQKLMLEVFKTLNRLNPSYLLEIFNEKQVGYNLRTRNLVVLCRTQTYGINSGIFSGSTLRNALTEEIKTCENVVAVKEKAKTAVAGYLDKVLFIIFSFSIIL